jgi:hypothetical protein
MSETAEAAVYVVQMRYKSDRKAGVAWEDIATVKVPPRTHRKTVIERAVEQAGITLEGAIMVRVLDAGSAQETQVEIEHLPPKLRIG